MRSPPGLLLKFKLGTAMSTNVLYTGRTKVATALPKVPYCKAPSSISPEENYERISYSLLVLSLKNILASIMTVSATKGIQVNQIYAKILLSCITSCCCPSHEAA